MPSRGGFGGLVVLQGVELFQEEQPGGLLGVVQLAGAAGVFPEDVVDVFEGLFKHEVSASKRGRMRKARRV